MPVVGFSPRKAASVLNGSIGFDGAAALLALLGKHTTGEDGCKQKKLADVDVRLIATLMEKAVAAARARPAKEAQKVFGSAVARCATRRPSARASRPEYHSAAAVNCLVNNNFSTSQTAWTRVQTRGLIFGPRCVANISPGRFPSLTCTPRP